MYHLISYPYCKTYKEVLNEINCISNVYDQITWKKSVIFFCCSLRPWLVFMMSKKLGRYELNSTMYDGWAFVWNSERVCDSTSQKSFTKTHKPAGKRMSWSPHDGDFEWGEVGWQTLNSRVFHQTFLQSDFKSFHELKYSSQWGVVISNFQRNHTLCLPLLKSEYRNVISNIYKQEILIFLLKILFFVFLQANANSVDLFSSEP